MPCAWVDDKDGDDKFGWSTRRRYFKAAVSRRRSCPSRASAAPSAANPTAGPDRCWRRISAAPSCTASNPCGYVVQSVFADTEIDPAAYCEGLALLSCPKVSLPFAGCSTE